MIHTHTHTFAVYDSHSRCRWNLPPLSPLKLWKSWLLHRPLPITAMMTTMMRTPRRSSTHGILAGKQSNYAHKSFYVLYKIILFIWLFFSITGRHRLQVAQTRLVKRSRDSAIRRKFSKRNYANIKNKVFIISWIVSFFFARTRTHPYTHIHTYIHTYAAFKISHRRFIEKKTRIEKQHYRNCSWVVWNWVFRSYSSAFLSYTEKL